MTTLEEKSAPSTLPNRIAASSGGRTPAVVPASSPGIESRMMSDSIAPTTVVSRKSASRLTIAEKAFARGLKALRERNYAEAERQLTGFLELMGTRDQPYSNESTHNKPHTLQSIRVVVEALALLLAISEEITILEREGR